VGSSPAIARHQAEEGKYKDIFLTIALFPENISSVDLLKHPYLKNTPKFTLGMKFKNHLVIN
jgi:hypothetical protein